MFNATYFTYDGTSSATYGLKIASINSNFVETTQVFSPNLTLNKGKRAKRFFHSGINYDEAPEYTFTVLSQNVIVPSKRREILRWLVGRNEFKKLELLDQEEYNGLWFNCVFTKVDIVYVGGECHGFELTAKFDSIYCYGEPQKYGGMLSTETDIEIDLTDSDIVDDYIYPQIHSVGSFILTNDKDTGRVTKYDNLTHPGYPVKIDGELRTISADAGSNWLSTFNKNWLRLLPGMVNKITVTTNGTFEIRVPTYKLIGF